MAESQIDIWNREEAERKAAYSLLSPSRQRQVNRRNLVLFVLLITAGILAWTSIVWIPAIAGIIYRALQP
jgi:hypothetical protein